MSRTVQDLQGCAIRANDGVIGEVDDFFFGVVMERAEQPVVRLAIEDVYDIGQEFFRWAMATAVAGSIIGINPFNPPDVEASTVATHDLTASFEKTGLFPTETPIFETAGPQLVTDAKNAAGLKQGLNGDRSLVGYSRAHLNRLEQGDTAGRTAPDISSRWFHNGIEYRMMAAHAEGPNILRYANAGRQASASDAETTPLRNPEHYQYDLNLPGITAALYERFSSRGQAAFSDQLLSVMGCQFGGHLEKKG